LTKVPKYRLSVRGFMGLLDNFRRSGPVETRTIDASKFGIDQEGASWISVIPDAGEDVTVEAAMRAAMGACIRLLADDIATLPWSVYRKRGKEVEPLAKPEWMLHPEGHRFSFPSAHKADAVVSLLSDGNLFVEGLGPAGTLNPRALYVLPPSKVDIERDATGLPVYTVTDDTGHRGKYGADRVAHLPWIRLPGAQRGLNMVEQAQEFTGIELAARRWAADFFRNGATLGGVVMLPREAKTPTKEAVKELRRDIEKRHKGPGKSWLLGVLTGGATIHDASIKPEEAELGPLWNHVLEEAARFYHVPSHLLASTAGSNVGTNVEQRSIEYVQHAILPVVERLEELYSALIPGTDTYVKFNVSALLRGDHKARAEASAIELQNGVITRDEWREREEYGPAPDGEGGYLRTPNNSMTDVRIEDASKLIRAGFDPTEALGYVGLEGSITHLGFSPTTQYDLDSEEPGSTEGTPAEDTVSERSRVNVVAMTPEDKTGLTESLARTNADMLAVAIVEYDKRAREREAERLVEARAEAQERQKAADTKLTEMETRLSDPGTVLIERDELGRPQSIVTTRGGKRTVRKVQRDPKGNPVAIK
jgi:HK97 family phage portal protein